MNTLIITPGYPKNKDPYNNSFVHQRVIEYLEHGINVKVFSVQGNPYLYHSATSCGEPVEYEFEKISVVEGSHGDLAQYLQQHSFDKILVHFAWKHTMRVIKKYAPDTPLIIWVHGVEALAWYRRLFNLSAKPGELIKFISYVVLNTDQLIYLHRFIKYNANNTSFVFVSDWMRQIFQKDTHQKSFYSYMVIPNVINESIFAYHEKTIDQRCNIFHIRPYHSKKYANDLMVRAILALKEHQEFDRLSFYLYGDGRLFNRTVKPLLGQKNVYITKGFLQQGQIAEEHKKCGVLLMPTRQDSQGVSMCEAMSSGLVPVVSNNTAIPEFVSNDIGYLCDTVDDMVDAILELVNKPEIFMEKSQRASNSIQTKCSKSSVIGREIELIKSGCTHVIGEKDKHEISDQQTDPN